MEGQETRNMKQVRMLNLRFNAGNVLKFGVGYIPMYVIFTISLGNSFGFPINPHDIHLESFKLAFEKIREEIIDVGTERS